MCNCISILLIGLIILGFLNFFIKVSYAWLSLFFAYFVVSTIFLEYPLILRKRKYYNNQTFNDLADCNKILRIAHRGGGWEGPEETIELLRQNKDRADMFELDVWLTGDKEPQLVVYHDVDTKRTSGVTKIVSDTKLADLPPFAD